MKRLRRSKHIRRSCVEMSHIGGPVKRSRREFLRGDLGGPGISGDLA